MSILGLRVGLFLVVWELVPHTEWSIQHNRKAYPNGRLHQQAGIHDTPARLWLLLHCGFTDTLGGGGLGNVHTSGVSTRAEMMARCERGCIDAGVELFDSILCSQQEADESVRRNSVNIFQYLI